MVRFIYVVAAAVGLFACQATDVMYTIHDDYQRELTVVHTGSGGGTPMLTVVGQFHRGTFQPVFGGVGEDYWQSFSRGGLAGLAEGAGIAAAGALIRPSKTVVSTTTGGAVATTGAVSVSARSSARSHATGGNPTATATGGSPSATATATNQCRFNPTACP